MIFKYALLAVLVVSVVMGIFWLIKARFLEPGNDESKTPKDGPSNESRDGEPWLLFFNNVGIAIGQWSCSVGFHLIPKDVVEMFPYFEQIFDEYCVLFVKVIIVVAIIQFTIGGILALIGWILEIDVPL